MTDPRHRPWNPYLQRVHSVKLNLGCIRIRHRATVVDLTVSKPLATSSSPSKAKFTCPTTNKLLGFLELPGASESSICFSQSKVVWQVRKKRKPRFGWFGLQDHGTFLLWSRASWCLGVLRWVPRLVVNLHAVFFCLVYSVYLFVVGLPQDKGQHPSFLNNSASYSVLSGDSQVQSNSSRSPECDRTANAHSHTGPACCPLFLKLLVLHLLSRFSF